MADIYISGNSRTKKGKLHKLFIVLISLVIVVAFAITVVAVSSFSKARQIMEEESNALSPFAANLLPSYSNVSFQTLDGQLNLYGWWLSAQTEETLATVILVHSQGMNRLPFGLDSVKLLDSLTEAGCSVLTFDLRNSAESDGTLSTFGYKESEDVLAALAYVELMAPDRPIILYGIGSGSTAVCRSMLELENTYMPDGGNNSGRQTDLPHPDRISALILDTPARSSDDFIAAKMANISGPGKFYYPRTIPLAIRLSSDNIDKQDYLNYLSQLTIPVLFLGYERDNFLPEKAYLPLWTERERIHPLLTQSFQVKGSGHLTAYKDDTSGYCQALSDFINKWF